MKTFHRPGVEKIARRMSAAALSSSLVLAAVALFVGQCGAAGRRPAMQPGQSSAAKAKTTSQHATKALASLPVAAQSAISASIGRDQSSYYVRATGSGFRTMTRGGALAAKFTRGGVHVQAGKANFGMAFEGIGRGNTLAAVQAAEPQAKANRVEYRHGALTEWYENGPLGLEQGFNVAKAPESRGREAGEPLTIALALTGDLSASLDSGGTSLTLRRSDGQPALRYTGLAAHDAAGQQLHAWLKLDGRRVLLQVNDADARYPIAVDPFVQDAKLTASDGAANDLFGMAVAVDGDTIVVGAPMATASYVQQGVAYVFVKPSTGDWADTSTFSAKLTASDAYNYNNFGMSVAINGNTIVVGAWGASYARGAAYVFVEPQGGWGSGTQLTQTTELTPSDLTQTDNPDFANSVAISGNTIVVGAPQASSNQGALYLYLEPTDGWASETTATETAKFTVADNASMFGYSVGISGNTIVAGAPSATVGSNAGQGAAYVFVEPSSGWTDTSTFSAKLTASDGATSDNLGTSVAIDNYTIVAGAPQVLSDRGAAYVFVEPTTGGWATTSSFAAKLTASDGAAEAYFGSSAAISGNTIVVGAPQATVTLANQGTAYVFVEPAAGWASQTPETETAEFTGSSTGDNLGYSVGISGNTIVAGAYMADINTNFNQGAAYVYEAQTTGAAPAITSNFSTTFTASTAGSFTVTTTGTPAPSISQTGDTLPSGVTFADNGDGTASLSGTPAAGTGGTYNLTFTASNGVTPDATQNFTLTVDEAPAITTTTNSTTFTVGTAGSFTMAASGYPAPTFSESGSLPSGVTFDTKTGVLSGTPAAATGGTYPLTITATNGVTPDATQNFTLTVHEAPSITSANSTTFSIGTAGSFTVTAAGYPTPTLGESGSLPSGVSFNAATGLLSGTPAAGTGGTYNLTFTASNGVGSNASQSFTLTVDQAPSITSANSTMFSIGTAGSFTVTAAGYPTPTLGESGSLPSGVSFNAATGVLSGTPAAGTGGTYNLTFTATNGVGSGASQSFTLTVNQTYAPTITSTASTTFTAGTTNLFSVTTTGYPAPSITYTGTLPHGVRFTDNGNGTATLAGRPGHNSGGSYTLTFTASNGVNPNATQTFTLSVNQALAFTSGSRTTFTEGVPGSFTVSATGTPTPTTITESGARLPAGVSFTDNGGGTATLSGTPGIQTAGRYDLTFTVSNGVSSVTQSFTLTVRAQHGGGKK